MLLQSKLKMLFMSEQFWEDWLKWMRWLLVWSPWEVLKCYFWQVSRISFEGIIDRTWQVPFRTSYGYLKCYFWGKYWSICLGFKFSLLNNYFFLLSSRVYILNSCKYILQFLMTSGGYFYSPELLIITYNFLFLIPFWVIWCNSFRFYCLIFPKGATYLVLVINDYLY